MTLAAVGEALIKSVIVLGGLATGAAYLVLLERKMAAWVQDRLGPNRVGIPLTRIRLSGLGQPMADGVKILLKEDVTPAQVDRGLFTLAPIIILVAAFAAFAVIPFGSVLPTNLGVAGIEEPIRLVIVPGMNAGVLYVFAVSGIAVYGVILGGWASNNKYSFLGGLRSSAQLVAYELPLGLGLLGVVAAAGSLDLETIITRQASGGWNALLQPLGFLVFVVAAFAEAARLPFDLPECEQELVGGYHTEYSGVRLLLFLLTEFLHMITGALLIVILFLGGWHFPFGVTGWTDEVGWVGAIVRVAVLAAKVLLVILVFMLVRWSWPRFRYDQLMTLAWKIMLPLGLVNFVAVIVLDQVLTLWGARGWSGQLLLAAASWGVCVVSLLVMALAAPSISDNRARRTRAAWDELV
ncbi:MAG: NADH-quinone oxidoreductase subunit NuoH [Pirellulaceae bacterium]|jgi:NADH-quinone oxidoreductase subunit H|nr:NADH-quinone oxidoreductase subunit NuoH [Pirellulaceae bacterium]